MIPVPLVSIDEMAPYRPEGYKEDVLSRAEKIDGIFCWLDEQVMAELLETYRGVKVSLDNKVTVKVEPKPLDPNLPGDAIAVVAKDIFDIEPNAMCDCNKLRLAMNVMGWENCWQDRANLIEQLGKSAEKFENFKPTKMQLIRAARYMLKASKRNGFISPRREALSLVVSYFMGEK